MSAGGFGSFLIVGGGLIGSSLARAARARGLVREVLLVDASPEVEARALSLGWADEAAPTGDAFAGRADVVALATPVRAMASAAGEAAKACAPEAVCFDTGSVKGAVIDAVAPALGDAAVFVPAHPIAGTERSGPEAGFATLFEGRWCILTPGADAPEPAVARVEAFWRGCGALTTRMSAADHDALLAATSHAPHLVAYALTATAMEDDGATRGDVVRYSAGGFRDFTRIAASDPVMWRDVFLTNRDATLEAIARFERRLGALRAAVEAGDGDALEAAFVATRAVRREIIAAGQEIAAPDFGRHPEADGE